MVDKYRPQARYRNKQGDRGQVRVSLWVPAEKEDEIKDVAKRMRRGLSYESRG